MEIDTHTHHTHTPRCSKGLKFYPAKVDLKRNKPVGVVKMK